MPFPHNGSRVLASAFIAITCSVIASACFARTQEQPPATASGAQDTATPASTAVTKPLADRVAITFTSPTGESTRTVVTARWDTGNETRKPRLRLSMGRLDIYASGGRLIATSRSDATTYYEAILPDPITPESIRLALPPIPLPHIQWCFGPSDQRTNSHPFGAQATLQSKGDDGLEQFTTSDGSLNVWNSGSPSRPRRIEFRNSHGATVNLALTPIDIKPDESWELSVEGRRKVESLAELRMDKAAPMVGRPMKDLGFTAPDFSDVSLADLLAPNPTVPNPTAANPNATHASILLVAQSTKDGMPVESTSQDLKAARNAIDAAVESLHTRDANADVRARVTITVLRGLPLAELDVTSALANATKLAEPLETSRIVPRVRNTTSADWILKDQLGDCSLALLVVDASRIVTHATALDSRADDVDAIRAEVLQALEKALGLASSADAPAPTTPAEPTTSAAPTNNVNPSAPTPAPK